MLRSLRGALSVDGGVTFGADFKQFFLRGLVVLLPSVLTLWICVKAYQFIDNTIAVGIITASNTCPRNKITNVNVG